MGTHTISAGQGEDSHTAQDESREDSHTAKDELSGSTNHPKLSKNTFSIISFFCCSSSTSGECCVEIRIVCTRCGNIAPSGDFLYSQVTWGNDTWKFVAKS